MAEVVKKPLKITETVLRDAHQSLIATRMTTEQMLPIVDKMDKVGYNAVECWGGATFDACLRFLKEDPWERLRKLRDGFKNTKLQMLFRGQNILGYRHYADDVVEYFVQKSISNGIDIIRPIIICLITLFSFIFLFSTFVTLVFFLNKLFDITLTLSPIYPKGLNIITKIFTKASLKVNLSYIAQVIIVVVKTTIAIMFTTFKIPLLNNAYVKLKKLIGTLRKKAFLFFTLFLLINVYEIKISIGTTNNTTDIPKSCP